MAQRPIVCLIARGDKHQPMSAMERDVLWLQLAEAV
jgi:hypothetical protein